MDNYTILRAFADSWFLIAMFVFYLGACVLPFINSQRSAVIEASTIPFRNDELSSGLEMPKLKKCSGKCAECKCSALKLEVL